MSFYSSPRIASVPLPDYSPFLTFGDVDFEIKSRPYIGLFERGCLLEDGSHNCTEVCTNRKLLFGNPAFFNNSTEVIRYENTTESRLLEQVPYNIHNCMLYPYISTVLTSRSAIAADRQAAQALAGYFEISPDLNSTSSFGNFTLWQQISYVQWNCASKFCTSGSKCGDGLTVDDFVRNKAAVQNGPGLPRVRVYPDSS